MSDRKRLIIAELVKKAAISESDIADVAADWILKLQEALHDLDKATGNPYPNHPYKNPLQKVMGILGTMALDPDYGLDPDVIGG